MGFGKKEVKYLILKKPIVISYTPRPEVRNLFGVIPYTINLLQISRTRYYSLRKNTNLKVMKLDGEYYVRVYPSSDLHVYDYNMVQSIKFTWVKTGKVEKLYFNKESIKP